MIKKIIFMLVCCFMSIGAVWAEEITPDQAAAVRWVQSQSTSVSDGLALDIVKTVYEKAALLGLEASLIFAIIKAESGFKTNATSKHGAKGLMQVLYKVHRSKFNGRSPYNATASIDVGTQIFRECISRSRNTMKALGCYLGGNPKKYAKIVLDNKHEFDRTVVIDVMTRDLPYVPMTLIAQLD